MVLELYHSDYSTCSQKVRLAMAEKGVTFVDHQINFRKGDHLSPEYLAMNPNGVVPTLVHDGGVVTDSSVIIEYLDERFPHPPLMPVDPVTRAQFRLALYRIERDWYTLAEKIEEAAERKQSTRARKILQESIVASSEVFAAKRFFLSDEFSLVDCTIAPILWRLPEYEIELSGPVQPIQRYMDEVFSRRSFQESLTDLELEMRQ